jgi:acyl transferase domain-containing protein
VVFLFPGQGATYPGMGRGLYDSEPAFRAAFDDCADALAPELGSTCASVCSPMTRSAVAHAIMQPATFAIEYALARVWMSHGLAPAR